MKANWILPAVISLCLAVTPGYIANAAENVAVISTYTGEETVSLYVNGVEGEVSSASCQLGTSTAEKVSFEIIGSGQWKTLIMIDNSLSVAKEDRKRVQDLLTKYVIGKQAGEQICVASFSETLSPMTEYTEDGNALYDAIETLAWQDQETYLTDVLYDVINEDAMGEEDCYRRIIVVSDGVDNKSIGYTREELYALLKEKPLPVYTIGCKNDKHKEELENMFALSRMTSAKYFLLEETEDVGTVAKSIHADDGVTKFCVNPAATDRDGTEKKVRLQIETTSGEITVETQAMMPLGQVLEAEEEPEELEEKESVPAPVQELAKEQSIFPFPLLLAIPVIFILVIIIVIFVTANNKKKKQRKHAAEAFQPDKLQELNVTDVLHSEERTEIVGSGSSGNTQMLWNEPAGSHILCLTDVNNPVRSFQIPIMDTVVIGRKAGLSTLIIDYDKSVSGKHCEISVRNGSYYVKDLQSSNGTFLNDVPVHSETELFSGSMLTMGRVKMQVVIK